MVDLESPRVYLVYLVARRKVTPSQSSKGIRESGINKVKELKDRTILNTTQFAIYVSRLRHQGNLSSRPTCSGEGIYLPPPLKTVTRFDPSANRTTGYIWPVVRRVATPQSPAIGSGLLTSRFRNTAKARRLTPVKNTTRKERPGLTSSLKTQVQRKRTGLTSPLKNLSLSPLSTRSIEWPPTSTPSEAYPLVVEWVLKTA